MSFQRNGRALIQYAIRRCSNHKINEQELLTSMAAIDLDATPDEEIQNVWKQIQAVDPSEASIEFNKESFSFIHAYNTKWFTLNQQQHSGNNNKTYPFGYTLLENVIQRSDNINDIYRALLNKLIYAQSLRDLESFNEIFDGMLNHYGSVLTASQLVQIYKLCIDIGAWDKMLVIAEYYQPKIKEHKDELTEYELDVYYFCENIYDICAQHGINEPEAFTEYPFGFRAISLETKLKSIDSGLDSETADEMHERVVDEWKSYGLEDPYADWYMPQIKEDYFLVKRGYVCFIASHSSDSEHLCGPWLEDRIRCSKRKQVGMMGEHPMMHTESVDLKRQNDTEFVGEFVDSVSSIQGEITLSYDWILTVEDLHK